MLSFIEEVKVDQSGYHQTPIADKYDEQTRHSKQILIFLSRCQGAWNRENEKSNNRKRLKMIQEIINPIKEVDFLGDNRFLLQPLTQSQ